MATATNALDSTKRRVEVMGILAAVAAAVLIPLFPSPQGLPPEGLRLAALGMVALILWVTEAIPIAVTALLILILQPILRIGDLGPAFTSFISPVFFFVLVMFFIAQSFVVTGLDRRFAFWLLSHGGTDTKRVVLVFMVGTAAISTIMSDVPCAAIFMAIALGLFDKMGLKPGQSQFAKAVMLGIPIASLIGGVGTPAGSSVNILGLFFIEQYGKVRVPFLHWMAIGIPMVVVLIPIAAWILTRVYPPEMKTIGDLNEIQEERARMGVISAQEKKVIAILGVMILCWLASTWIKQLDTVMIGIGGAIVMFLPGIRLFTWKQVERGTGWDSLLMIGGVTSIGAASVKTGLAKWIVDTCLGGIQSWDLIWIIAGISAFTVVVHLLIPIAPVINGVLIPPIALLAAASGHNPALFCLPVAFTASCAFLLPLDAVALVTYGKGYYRMLDMFVPGLLISVCWVILMTALIMVLGPVLGLT